jgi:hypothetical protein
MSWQGVGMGDHPDVNKNQLSLTNKGVQEHKNHYATTSSISPDWGGI